jgi:hypothetical protein
MRNIGPSPVSIGALQTADAPKELQGKSIISWVEASAGHPSVSWTVTGLIRLSVAGVSSAVDAEFRGKTREVFCATLR